MRALLFSLLSAVALSSVAAAQAPAPAAPAVDAAAKLTPVEVKTLKDRLTAIDIALRKELTTHFASLPVPARDPAAAAAQAVYLGTAYTVTPVTERQKLLVDEHDEILVQLKAAGEKPPVVRRPRAPPRASQMIAG